MAKIDVSDVRELTAEQWQLFTEEPGVNQVAKRLNAGLRSTIRQIRKNLPRALKVREREDRHQAIEKVCYEAYKKHLQTRFYKYVDFGAADTEPRTVAASYIQRELEQNHSYYHYVCCT